MKEKLNKLLWGAASSSFQAEGMWQQAGQGPSVIELDQPDNIPAFKQGADFYHHYEEDIKLMKQAGLTAFRFSISWPRVLPDGTGKVNEDGINFYHNIIKTLKKYDIEPIITIYHFDYPLALIKKYGGWVNRQSISDYLSYCQLLFTQFGGDVKYWITINEQDHVVRIPTRLGFKDHDFNKHMQDCYQANHNMSVASALAIKLCHDLLPQAKIGPALSYQPYYAASNYKKDIDAAKMADLLSQRYILDLQCKGKYSKEFKDYLKMHGVKLEIPADDLKILQANQPDFLGVNYYSSNIVSNLPANEKQGIIEGSPIPKKEYGLYEIKNDPKLPTTKWGWTVDPKGLRVALTNLYQTYHLPILICENGYGDEDEINDQQINDDKRISYLKAHLKELLNAIHAGVPVLGYCIWSFTDLVSGHNGNNKRYGLVYVDNQMKRIPKKSFKFYQDFIKQVNGDV